MQQAAVEYYYVKLLQVRLKTSHPFHGVIHARDSRDNACLTYGTGRSTTFLTINLLTPHDHPAYCGVVYSNVSIKKFATKSFEPMHE